jgi:Bacteriocin-protection, YdeI or OmpD-Associated/Domain of unknown function (DUF1905)
MSDYVTFEGKVTPLDWGRATYTILRLPDDVVNALGKTRRVEGEINDHPVNLALTRAPVCPDVFLWAGQSLLDRVGIVPGETIEVRLRPAPDDAVDVPDDVTVALRTADVTALWAAMTPGKQRGHLHQISTAKTATTRNKRIAALIATLTGQP